VFCNLVFLRQPNYNAAYIELLLNNIYSFLNRSFLSKKTYLLYIHIFFSYFIHIQFFTIKKVCADHFPSPKDLFWHTTFKCHTIPFNSTLYIAMSKKMVFLTYRRPFFWKKTFFIVIYLQRFSPIELTKFKNLMLRPRNRILIKKIINWACE